VRVIAASNRRVEQEIEQGRFRQDLFYRLNAVSIHLPPLRERREDILPLAISFAERARSSTSAISFSPEALYLLENYPWPGNIRELENAVVRAVALSSGVVRPEDLPDHIRGYRTTLSEVASEQDTDAEQRHDDRWLTLSEMEARYVKRVLNHTKGNKQAASRLLNIDPKTIERMIRRYDIEIEYDIKIR
jgi:two-component system, NtrC family, response regulator AtoC